MRLKDLYRRWGQPAHERSTELQIAYWSAIAMGISAFVSYS